MRKLEAKLEFSEESDEWQIKDGDGEEVRAKKPSSSLGLRAPLCEFSRMAVGFGDTNAR